MTSTMTLRPWLGLVALTVASLLGTTFSRSKVNTIERERLLQAAAEEIESLPAAFGPWRAASAEPLSDDLLRTLHCRAHQSRTYVKEGTGERVSLLLLAGSAGPLVALPPQACYEGDQLDSAEPGQPVTIEDGIQFLKFTLRSRAESEKALWTYLAWRTARGGWQAPRNPRLALGDQPMLFRLQVATVTGVNPAEGAAESDACRNFLSEFLHAVNQTSRSN